MKEASSTWLPSALNLATAGLLYETKPCVCRGLHGGESSSLPTTRTHARTHARYSPVKRIFTPGETQKSSWLMWPHDLGTSPSRTPASGQTLRAPPALRGDEPWCDRRAQSGQSTGPRARLPGCSQEPDSTLGQLDVPGQGD